MSGPVRAVAYLCGVLLLVTVAFLVGVLHYEETQCTGYPGGECDLGMLEGAVWAAVCLLVGIVVVIDLELRWRGRHGPGRRPALRSARPEL